MNITHFVSEEQDDYPTFADLARMVDEANAPNSVTVKMQFNPRTSNIRINLEWREVR